MQKAETHAQSSLEPTPALDVRNLRMRYRSTEVLHGVDLHVDRGEVVALLGPNGAGKTTTIEILEGIRRRSDGHVRVLGVDPDHGDEEWRSRVGVVLQSWRDHRRWKVGELLHHLAAYYKPFSNADRVKPYDPETLLENVGLQDKADTKVSRLSGGQRRRLDVAIGLVGNPELLFLDEPTVGFDPEARQDFHDLIRSIARGRSMAIVLTTHDLSEAELLADSVAILVAGKIVARGATWQIAQQHAWGTEVSYRHNNLPEKVVVEDATAYVRDLLSHTNADAVTDLAVKPLGLQDAYLTMVRDADNLQEFPSPEALPTTNVREEVASHAV